MLGLHHISIQIEKQVWPSHNCLQQKHIWAGQQTNLKKKKNYRLSTETFQCRYMNNIIINIVDIVGILDIIA